MALHVFDHDDINVKAMSDKTDERYHINAETWAKKAKDDRLAQVSSEFKKFGIIKGNSVQTIKSLENSHRAFVLAKLKEVISDVKYSTMSDQEVADDLNKVRLIKTEVIRHPDGTETDVFKELPPIFVEVFMGIPYAPNACTPEDIKEARKS